MSTKCARCEKTVYPMEELRCLDKVWHKACFKCTECGVMLNLQNYKGFEKTPYCRVHVPQVKATQVASTPEIKRATKITKMQSIVEYHAAFEKSKSQYTAVSDTPENRRVKEAGILASNVTYHGEQQKKAMMDMKRQLGENEIVNMKTSPDDESRHAPTLIFSSSSGAVAPVSDADTHVGSIANYDAPDSPPPASTSTPTSSARGTPSDGTPSKTSSVGMDSPSPPLGLKISSAGVTSPGIAFSPTMSPPVVKKFPQELATDDNANYTPSPGVKNTPYDNSDAAFVSASTGIDSPLAKKE